MEVTRPTEPTIHGVRLGEAVSMGRFIT